MVFRHGAITNKFIYSAYPLTDKPVRNYLLEAPSVLKETECREHLRAFLISLFKSASLAAEELFPGKPSHARSTKYSHVAKAFHDLFADGPKRSIFYNQVIAGITSIQHRTQDEVSRAFKNLVGTLKGYCSDWPGKSVCPVIISMDEVHVLFKLRDGEKESTHTLYSRLKSVLSEVVSEAFCVISLSTATSISQLAPSRALAPSFRERDENIWLPSPFTELPFDAYINAHPLAPGQEDLSSVGSLEFTAMFGRPLYDGFI